MLVQAVVSRRMGEERRRKRRQWRMRRLWVGRPVVASKKAKTWGCREIVGTSLRKNESGVSLSSNHIVIHLSIKDN